VAPIEIVFINGSMVEICDGAVLVGSTGWVPHAEPTIRIARKAAVKIPRGRIFLVRSCERCERAQGDREIPCVGG